MRNPNGFGTVVKLSGNRRKPFAVRVTVGWDLVGDNAKQKYKYVGYYATRKEATIALAEYNAGKPIESHKIGQYKTFADVYGEFISWRTDPKGQNPISDKQYKIFESTFKKFSNIHNASLAYIGVDDVQPIFDDMRNYSDSYVKKHKSTLTQVYAFAIKKGYIDYNLADRIDVYYTKSTEEIHKPFTDDEIAMLWDRQDLECCQFCLIAIYSGMRPSEILGIKNENVHLDKDYIIGGSKTKVGINRIIPIHSKIKPLIASKFAPNSVFLFNGGNLSINVQNKEKYVELRRFKERYWRELEIIGIQNHLPHDGRHTFATLADRYQMNPTIIKQIMGHTLNQDVTESVYIHRTPEILKREIEKITI